MIDKDTTNYNLRNAREQWLDKLRYKKIKLAKCEEKWRRKTDKIIFQWDQMGFFRTLKGEEALEGEMPEMEKFVEFWRGTSEREREREREERIPYMSWMEEIRTQLNEKVSQVNEFNIIFEKVKKEVAKRKGWTAPGIDGIQNYWWKKARTSQKSINKGIHKNQGR